MDKIKLRPRQFLPRGVKNPVVSVQNGYLWIGGDEGPCSAVITGKKTLHKIAAMLKRYAR